MHFFCVRLAADLKGRPAPKKTWAPRGVRVERMPFKPLAGKNLLRGSPMTQPVVYSSWPHTTLPSKLLECKAKQLDCRNEAKQPTQIVRQGQTPGKAGPLAWTHLPEGRHKPAVCSMAFVQVLTEICNAQAPLTLDVPKLICNLEVAGVPKKRQVQLQTLCGWIRHPEAPT